MPGAIVLLDKYVAGHAARADHHAATLAANCEDARTPGPLEPSAAVPLTRRESEIATLAEQFAAQR